MFWNNIFTYKNRDGPKTPITSKMEFFVTLANSWKSLSNVTKSSILDVVEALVVARNNVQKQPWWALPSFTCILLFLGKTSVAEVENFKLVWLALAALNNFRGDKIKTLNKEVSKL